MQEAVSLWEFCLGPVHTGPQSRVTWGPSVQSQPSRTWKMRTYHFTWVPPSMTWMPIWQHFFGGEAWGLCRALGQAKSKTQISAWVAQMFSHEIIKIRLWWLTMIFLMVSQGSKVGVWPPCWGLRPWVGHGAWDPTWAGPYILISL